ncbi:hypothetical protein [Thiopseudomonas alkaliphila]|uniref:hypothetical protein n=1 Tax=Thiopseudomonas alkaliphila TaxID=1697053 RepID=UPI0025776470|nr:hypothetical protein [Thiopseudomonas alkaliphila]MDM1717334.1 hypothetical protein [Thiopseudomonas alkaliphila]
MKNLYGELEKIENDNGIIYLSVTEEQSQLGVIRVSRADLIVGSEELKSKVLAIASEHFCLEDYASVVAEVIAINHFDTELKVSVHATNEESVEGSEFSNDTIFLNLAPVLIY